MLLPYVEIDALERALLWAHRGHVYTPHYSGFLIGVSQQICKKVAKKFSSVNLFVYIYTIIKT